jgi:glycogen operon protein
VFRRTRFLVGVDAVDLQWFTPGGTSMTPSNWADPGARCISIYLDGGDAPDRADDGTFLFDDDVLVLINGWWEPMPFVIPDVGQAHDWTVELNTYDWRAAPASTPTGPGGLLTVGPQSITVLRSPRRASPETGPRPFSPPTDTTRSTLR